MKALFESQVVRFLAVGGFAACVNFFSRILFDLVLGFTPAIVLAYLCGMITAFYLNKLFVFSESANNTSVEAFYFSLVNIAAVFQTWAVSVGLYNYLLAQNEFGKEISHFVGVIVPVFTSFVGHKYLTFREQAPAD